MKKRWIAFLLAGALSLQCFGCTGKADIQPIQEQTEVTTEDNKEQKDYKVDITEEAADALIRYQDDYYEYVNRELLDMIHLGQSDAQWTWFGELTAVTSQEMRTIIQNIVNSKEYFPKGSPEQKIRDLYQCISDMDNRNTTGLEPLRPYMDAIEAADSIDEYVDAITVLSADLGFSSLVGGYLISTDRVDSSKYSVYLSYADTLIGKEYLESNQMQDYVTMYFDYVQQVLEEYGMEESQALDTSSQIEVLVRDICEASLDSVQYYDPSMIYNPYTREELAQLYTNVDIPKMLKTLGVDSQDQYIVMDVGQAKKVNSLLVEENLDILKKFSIFVAIKDVSSYSTQQYAKLEEDIKNKLYGVTESRSDEFTWMSLTQNMLQWDFGKIYVDRYFSEESKNAVEAIIYDIVEAYKSIINRQEWMSEKTKEKACRKLDMLEIKIGYPDEWPETMDRQQVTPVAEGGSLLANLLDFSKITIEDNLNKLGEEVDMTAWGMAPQTVNAYYDPSKNEIVFPAAILQSPFFSKDNFQAQNLGGIGYVIAHEISHAFDWNGALYDEYGNYNLWWEQEEIEEYQKLTQSIVEYYNQYEMVGIPVNGELTLSENIADLGAMTCITSIIGDDTDALSEAFSQFAYMWASEATIGYQMSLLSTDVHAPNKIRVNAVLSASDAFYQTYDIAETDEMYVKPENRVGIWK